MVRRRSKIPALRAIGTAEEQIPVAFLGPRGENNPPFAADLRRQSANGLFFRWRRCGECIGAAEEEPCAKKGEDESKRVSAKPSKGVSRKTTTPRKAGGS